MSEQSEYFKRVWHNAVTFEAERAQFYPACPQVLDADGFETMVYYRSELAQESTRKYILQQIHTDSIAADVQTAFGASDREMQRFRRNEHYVTLDYRTRLQGRNKHLLWVYPDEKNETRKRRMKLVSVDEVMEAPINIAEEGEGLGVFPQALLSRIASGETIYVLPWALMTSYDFTCTSWGNSTSPLTGTVNHASVGWVQGDYRAYWAEPELRPNMSLITTRVWSEETSAYLNVTSHLDYFYRMNAIAAQAWNMSNPLDGSVFSSND